GANTALVLGYDRERVPLRYVGVPIVTAPTRLCAGRGTSGLGPQRRADDQAVRRRAQPTASRAVGRAGAARARRVSRHTDRLPNRRLFFDRLRSEERRVGKEWT